LVPDPALTVHHDLLVLTLKTGLIDMGFT